MDNKILKATHEGILKIDGSELNVAVLNNGIRVITTSAVFKALDRPARGNSRVTNIPVFMDAKNLHKFISKGLMEVINKVEYLNKNNKKQTGYDATILPLVSELYLIARENGVITMPSQLETAKKAEILVRSLAKVGITALVDEATGYQYEREKTELQKILSAYISEEVARWQLTFKMDFYKELFRLWGQPFNPNSVKRPSFVGKLTNNFIYKALPEGVLETLKEKTPKTDAGNYKHKFHQSLTPEIGREHLKTQIIEVTALMSVCDTKEESLELFNKKYADIYQRSLL